MLLGNVIRGFHGGAVLFGNGIPGFHGGPVALGISLQVAKRIGMVGCGWCWVADGGAVLLGSLIASG